MKAEDGSCSETGTIAFGLSIEAADSRLERFEMEDTCSSSQLIGLDSC